MRDDGPQRILEDISTDTYFGLPRHDDHRAKRYKASLTETIHCGHCAAEDIHECVPRSVKQGQSPTDLILSDGTESRVNLGGPDSFFGLRAPTTFYAASFWIIPPYKEMLKNNYPNAFYAAAEYAGASGLNIPNYDLFSTSENPTARILLDIMGGKSIEPYWKPWMPFAAPIISEIQSTIQHHGITGEQDKLKLASLALLRANAHEMGQFVSDVARIGKDGSQGRQRVIATMLDINAGRLRVISPFDPLIKAFHDHSGRPVTVPYPAMETDTTFISCCDARANGSHAVMAGHGEILNHNIISLIVPPQENALEMPDSTWPIMRRAKHHIMMPHSGCGGMAAGIKMVTGRETYGKFLTLWLKQAEPEFLAVLSHARHHNICENAAIVNLAAQWVAVTGASRLNRITGDNIPVEYIDIASRNVDRVPNARTIAKMQKGTRPFICEVPPENIHNPPPACPPLNDGAPRRAHHNTPNIAFVRRSASQQGYFW